MRTFISTSNSNVDFGNCQDRVAVIVRDGWLRSAAQHLVLLHESRSPAGRSRRSKRAIAMRVRQAGPAAYRGVGTCLPHGRLCRHAKRA
jgi:hypothetical protein